MEKFNQTTFATNLRMLRAAAKLTKEEVASKIGVSVGTIANYENGVTVPDYRVCWVLADLYGVSMDDLGSRDEHGYAA